MLFITLPQTPNTDDSDDSTSQSSSPTRHQCRECGEKFSRLAFLKKHAKVTSHWGSCGARVFEVLHGA